MFPLLFNGQCIRFVNLQNIWFMFCLLKWVPLLNQPENAFFLFWFLFQNHTVHIFYFICLIFDCIMLSKYSGIGWAKQWSRTLGCLLSLFPVTVFKMKHICFGTANKWKSCYCAYFRNLAKYLCREVIVGMAMFTKY